MKVGLIIYNVSILLFLLIPILVLIPASLMPSSYFVFSPDMLSFDLNTYTLKWYNEFFISEKWLTGLRNSFFVGVVSSMLAVFLGTPAALWLSTTSNKVKNSLLAFMLTPAIIPVIISSTAWFFFFAKVNLVHSFTGLIISHTMLGLPFVILSVLAALTHYDHNLTKTSFVLGAGPYYTFRHVIFPLIKPGLLAGALLAFITSFDDLIVALFIASYEQHTLPLQMWSGIKENINPEILAVTVLLIIITTVSLFITEFLKKKTFVGNKK